MPISKKGAPAMAETPKEGSLRWEYEQINVWKAMSEQTQKKIESSIKAKRKNISVKLKNGDEGKVHLETMDMTFEGGLKCQLRTSILADSKWVVWCTEKSFFFTPQEVKKLESAYSHGKKYVSLAVVVEGKSCKVDLETMTLSSSEDLKLLRVPSDDELDTMHNDSDAVVEESDGVDEEKPDQKNSIVTLENKPRKALNARKTTIKNADTDTAKEDEDDAGDGGVKGRKRRAAVKTEAKADDDNDKDDNNGSKKRKATVKKTVKKITDDGGDGKDDDDDYNVKVVKKKVPAKKRKANVGKKRSKKDEEEEEKEEETEQSVKMLPKVLRLNEGPMVVPVDLECLKQVPNARVFTEEEDYGESVVFDCMLNQTNIQHNNNKFYIIQLVEGDTLGGGGVSSSSSSGGGPYHVWMRWGRVGVVGQSSLQSFGSNKQKAINYFENKFHSKTHNDWAARDFFEKEPGKYDVVEIEYDLKKKRVVEKDGEMGGGGGGVVDVEKEVVKIPDSKLDLKLQALIRLIYDLAEMEGTLKEMHYDAVKTPLGQLTQEQINMGFMTLKVIDDLLNNKQQAALLLEASNDYYTQIPHYFGMSRPPIINNKHLLLKEINLLETLGQIEVAVRMLKKSALEYQLNPLDSRYLSLNNHISPLSRESDNFKLIQNYLLNTHGETHTAYKMEVMEVFGVERQGERERFKDVGNNMLLWHGSRLSNMVGILSQGLRIAPPEAPVTGYMFGKGIYFADMSSKSANYCFTNRSKNTGFLLLSQVSLGEMNELYTENYNGHVLPAGKHSVKGLGRIRPSASGSVTWEGGVVVPTGKAIQGDENEEKEDDGAGKSKRRSAKARPADKYSLMYNEYIVYDPEQVRLRFLVQVRFLYR